MNSELTLQLSGMALINGIHQQNVIFLSSFILFVMTYRSLKRASFKFSTMQTSDMLQLAGTMAFVASLGLSLVMRYLFGEFTLDPYYMNSPSRIQEVSQFIFVIQTVYVVVGSILSVIGSNIRGKSNV